MRVRTGLCSFSTVRDDGSIRVVLRRAGPVALEVESQPPPQGVLFGSGVGRAFKLARPAVLEAAPRAVAIERDRQPGEDFTRWSIVCALASAALPTGLGSYGRCVTPILGQPRFSNRTDESRQLRVMCCERGQSRALSGARQRQEWLGCPR